MGFLSFCFLPVVCFFLNSVALGTVNSKVSLTIGMNSFQNPEFSNGGRDVQNLVGVSTRIILLPSFGGPIFPPHRNPQKLEFGVRAGRLCYLLFVSWGGGGGNSGWSLTSSFSITSYPLFAQEPCPQPQLCGLIPHRVGSDTLPLAIVSLPVLPAAVPLAGHPPDPGAQPATYTPNYLFPSFR